MQTVYLYLGIGAASRETGGMALEIVTLIVLANRESLQILSTIEVRRGSWATSGISWVLLSSVF